MSRRAKIVISIVLSMISLAAVAATSPTTEAEVEQG